MLFRSLSVLERYLGNAPRSELVLYGAYKAVEGDHFCSVGSVVGIVVNGKVWCIVRLVPHGRKCIFSALAGMSRPFQYGRNDTVEEPPFLLEYPEPGRLLEYYQVVNHCWCESPSN